MVEIGVESASEISVRRARKVRPSTHWLEERINLLNDAGIRVAGNIIVGLPHDSGGDYERTLEFIESWRQKLWFNVYGYVPYPGTPMHDELVAAGRIRTWDYAEWCEGAPLVFEPFEMTPDRAYEWFIATVLSVAGKDNDSSAWSSL